MIDWLLDLFWMQTHVEKFLRAELELIFRTKLNHQGEHADSAVAAIKEYAESLKGI